MEEFKDREFEFKDEDFKFIVGLVNKKTGIQLADHKRQMVYGRLARRLRELNLNKFKDYCDLLESPDGDKEITNFVNAVTTNLTGFFREGHHFDHLKEILAGQVAKPPPGKKIRIWSSACSSGPEPYSIAMTACEAISNISTWDFKILATDIDTNMLKTSKEGFYNASMIDKIPKTYQNKYLTRESRKSTDAVMSDKLKSLITFNQLNLLENWPMKGPFDIIFCRNVVIYFDKETQRVLFDKMAEILKMGGYLYIGHSENLFNVCNRFESVGRTIYRRIS